MLVIGLTGGIGAGKTIVANLFSEYGVPIIDADKIARELTESDQPVLAQIAAHFGPSILTSAGSLNRRLLRDIIFKTPAERLWLENLLHPLIQQEIEMRLKQLTAPYCIIVIPLLFETESTSFLHRILVVDASKETQIKRIQQRDQLSVAQIEAILTVQTQREHKLQQAHDVITNEGEIAELIPQVKKLHEFYLEKSK
jgi:dephospho-CoA kinase